MAGKKRFNGLDLAHALDLGAKTAYKAVARPVEGDDPVLGAVGPEGDEGGGVGPGELDVDARRIARQRRQQVLDQRPAVAGVHIDHGQARKARSGRLDQPLAAAVDLAGGGAVDQHGNR